MRRIVIAVLLFSVAVVSIYANTLAAKQSVTARLIIDSCYETENLSVPIDRSFRGGGIGIGGGGNGPCNYSYNLRAVRADQNRVNLYLNVSVAGRTFEKQFILTRGKPLDAQLELGVRLRAHF